MKDGTDNILTMSQRSAALQRIKQRNPDDLVKPAEVSRILDVCGTTARQIIDNEMPYVNVSRGARRKHRRVRIGHLEAYVLRQERQS